MKKIKIFNLFLGSLLLVAVGCNNWIDPDYNVDPNNPADVSMDKILPSVQGAWAYMIVGPPMGNSIGVML